MQHETDVSTPGVEPFHSGCGTMGFLDVWGSRAGRAGSNGRSARISSSVPKLSSLTHHERSEAENQNSPCPLHL